MDTETPQSWAYYVGNTRRTDGTPIEVRACYDGSLVGTTFRPPDEAIEEAVNSAVTAFEKLEVGGVVANDVPTFRADHMPYGGTKDSGTGREGARYAIEEMTERKILVLNLD